MPSAKTKPTTKRLLPIAIGNQPPNINNSQLTINNLPVPHALVFDISYDTLVKSFLPTAYIVEENQGSLGYIEKIAIPETLAACEINVNPQQKEALQLCEYLKKENLTKKYCLRGKSKISLEHFLKEPANQRVINQYTQLKLTQFIQLCFDNTLIFSVNINKTKPFEPQKCNFENQPIQPNLHFVKTENGITYTLHLSTQTPLSFASPVRCRSCGESPSRFVGRQGVRLEQPTTEIYPFEHNVTVLTNEPAWVVINQTIGKIEHINGNKLKPFLTKKAVEIPLKNTQEYFEKFIKDIVKKVNIQAEGFRVEQQQTITNCFLEPIKHLFSDTYLINILFDYQGVIFSTTDKKQVHSQLKTDATHEFFVVQTKRNTPEEQKIIQQLTTVGIQLLDSGFASVLPIKELTDAHQNVEYLLENKAKLNENGFEIASLLVDNKKINPNFGVLNEQLVEKTDWFDVNIQIICGSFEFSFAKIIPNIKTNNRYYELPDGTFFLIPMAWFSTYKPIAEFAKIENNTVKIQKNQFTLLKKIQPTAVSETSIFEAERVIYKPLETVKATLRPYQTEGVEWLLTHFRRGLGACLADDMGLGKTLQTLVALEAHHTQNKQPETAQLTAIDLFSTVESAQKQPLKALIICPTSLVFNWYNEAKKFVPHLKLLQYIGNNRQLYAKRLANFDLVITSYPIALKDENILQTYDFQFLIVDESQYIKNKNAKIFKTIHQFSAQHKVSLSGTPIENSLADLWSQMQFINPNLLGSYAFFTDYFKNPIEKKHEEAKTEELKTLVNPYILRRTKAQVLTELPPVTEQIFYTELLPEQQELYETEKSTARDQILNPEASKVVVLNTLMRLRQLANHPKLVNETAESGKFFDVTQYLETLVKAKQKTLIFSSFTQQLAIYTHWCEQQKIPFQTLTGATQNREEVLTAFQNSTHSFLFFISLKAGGVGLNLTEASYIVFLDPWWNPFAEQQAISRAHRMGQKNHVNVVRFIAQNTIEEKIIQLQTHKKELSDKIISETAIPESILTDLAYLLE